jgi:hypothetical protein
VTAFEAITQFITHLLVPSVLIRSVWRAAGMNFRRWLANIFVAGSFIGYASVAGAWPTFGYPIRYIFPVILIVVAIGSLGRARSSPRLTPVSGDIVRFVVAALFAFMLGWALRGYRYPARAAADLRFPLHQGIYAIANGGSTPVMNYHASIPGQQYGVDITRLHWYGLSAAGIAPRDLKRYAIFGDEIVAPCGGRVLSVTDGLPDAIPPIRTPVYAAAGNTVVLDCGRGLMVVLAHMQRGSVRVGEGGEVTPGAVLGRVGSSGGALEPSLHIHAQRGGRSVPIRFDRRFPVRNNLFVAPR